MKLKNNESGIAHLAAMLAVVVVVAIGIVGWKVWSNKDGKKDENVAKSQTTTQTSKEKQKSVDESEDWKTYNASFDIRTGEKVNFSFQYPSDWVAFDTQATNAIDLKSPNYVSEQGFGDISAGSALSVSVEVNEPNINGQVATLEEIANYSMGIRNLKPTKVGSNDALQYESNGSENQSLTFTTLILRSGKIYRVTQYYALNVSNPYPTLIANVLKTLEFKD